ncbi:MAG: metal-dependent hydrolase [Pseudomonadota bacterium]|nr:metal-dependent hydrolase [Pseudomonadota bacterium]
MDNITHSLVGWTLGQAGLKTQTRKGLAALILAANMPDVDVFFGWVAWDPLAIHRGITHSLVGGAVVMPPILAGLLLLLDRWQLSRGKTFGSGLPMRVGRLVALCYIGALTHPLLDLTTTYSVQLLSPFSTDWFHADSLFIIDLMLWLLLGLAIFWSKLSERKGGAWRRPAQAAIAIALAYIAVNLAISHRAHSKVQQWAGDRQAEAVFASPPPFYFWRRDVTWREGDCYRRSSFDPLAGFGDVSECEPTNMDDPLVHQAIRSDPSLQKFLKWSIMPQAAIERSRCSAKVTIGDARYGRRGSSRLSRESAIRTC